MNQPFKREGFVDNSEPKVVETKVIENKETIIIEQSNPQVVYVPSYNPTVVYGPPVYPYPPIYYPPPPPPGYYAAGMAISFGVGVAMGAFWSGGSCCGARGVGVVFELLCIRKSRWSALSDHHPHRPVVLVAQVSRHSERLPVLRGRWTSDVP